jgi:molybdopterin molybdotransferase
MIGLPGNPVSAMVCGEIFVRPTVDAMMGLPAEERQQRPTVLAKDLGQNGPREHYMRAIVGTDGQCEVFENQDSSLVATLARANALVVRAPRAPAAKSGDIVSYIPL